MTVSTHISEFECVCLRRAREHPAIVWALLTGCRMYCLDASDVHIGWLADDKQDIPHPWCLFCPQAQKPGHDPLNLGFLVRPPQTMKYLWANFESKYRKRLVEKREKMKQGRRAFIHILICTGRKNMMFLWCFLNSSFSWFRWLLHLRFGKESVIDEEWCRSRGGSIYMHHNPFRGTPTWQIKNMVFQALNLSCNQTIRLFALSLHVDV